MLIKKTKNKGYRVKSVSFYVFGGIKMNKKEQTENKYMQLEAEHNRLIENLKNYRYRLIKEVRTIDNILKEQSATFFHSKEYYEELRLEKLRLACTINNIIKGEWNIDKDGDIIEIFPISEEKIQI